MDLTIEYLIIIEKKAANALFRLCDSVKAFKKFLETEDEVSISETNIQFKEKYTFQYKLKAGEVKGKDQRFFHLKLISPEKEDYIIQLASLSKIIRALVHNSDGQPETLWNDISLYYSKRSYPLIHNIENLMRKLITFFMLTNVGKEWISEASPSAVKEAIDKSKRRQYIDVLHQIDFKHLGDFLFKIYQNKDNSELFKIIDNAEKNNNELIAELKSFIPRSNWDRYFSTIVDCEGEYLDKRWQQLYELRCMIAHNAIVGADEYQRIVNITKEISKYLQSAFDNLDKINIPDEDKEQVVEIAVVNINKAYGDFLEIWKKTEKMIFDFLQNLNYDETIQISNSIRMLQILYENEQISASLMDEGIKISQFKNSIMHDSAVSITEQEINTYTNRLNKFYEIFKVLLKPVSFHEECIMKIAKHLNINLQKRTITKYSTKDYNIAISCAVSKEYEKGNNIYYWFAFHPHQKNFLEKANNSYVAFGCGSEENTVLIPLDKFSKYLEKMNTTDSNNRFYWHVHIANDNGKLYLNQRKDSNIDLTEYII